MLITELILSDGRENAPTDVEISEAIASIKKAHGGHMDIPMPGEGFLLNSVVIASTWLCDDSPVTCLVMALNPSPPYYSVAELCWSYNTQAWGLVWRKEFPNINPATEEYAQSGGDY
jgi:hypothetical protein